MNAWSRLLVTTGLARSEAAYEIYLREPTEKLQQAIITTRDALARLSASCKKRGLPLGIVVIPDTRVRPVLEGKAEYRLERPEEILLSLPEVNGIPVVDLTRAFADHSKYYYPVDGHWNAQGHRLAGRIIANSLLKGDLQPLLQRSADFREKR
jgi:hypothetical protein